TGTWQSVIPVALAGLMFGLAVGCRPHLALSELFAGVILWRCLRGVRPSAAVVTRQLLAFTLPFGACALILASYNYARFGDPFEFGVRYMMASADYYGLSASFRNLRPGLYYLLACPPAFDPVFPFIRLVLRTRFNSTGLFLPARYFLEPIAGVFAIWQIGRA